MKKAKTRFVCKECGSISPKWMGRCPECEEWNTIIEEKVESKKGKNHYSIKPSKPVKLKDIDLEEEYRFSTGIQELDRVLGGGIVPGGVTLVAGDPGIGKSTLFLQVSSLIADNHGIKNVLYTSGEESLKQIKIRADRLSLNNDNFYLASETNVEEIAKLIVEMAPEVVVIDSIQTLYDPNISSAPGSVSQVRESASYLLRIAKEKGISIFLIGHVTKQGSIAGPKVLEHIVDTVLHFEGEMHYMYRILRTQKNRFGSTNEIGIFKMADKGLIEVRNPSEMLLSGRPNEVPGSVVVSSIEGSRSLLIELQALLSPTGYGMPRRMTNGVDYNRVMLLMAVLEKRVGIVMSNQDTYVNVAGGIKMDEPAVDLGIAVAIASSAKDKKISPDTVVIGEVGLTGEIRGVNFIEKRLKEAEKMGFKKCIIPYDNKLSDSGKDMKIIKVKSLKQALDILFL